MSQDKIDIAELKGAAGKTIGNNKKEICRWIKSLKETSQTIVVMEATGGYESMLVKLLHEHPIALAVVNPRQVRDFAANPSVSKRYGETMHAEPGILDFHPSR